MREGRIGAAVLILASIGFDQGPDRRPFPDPPGQGKPWTATATKLPRFLVTATEALFAQGVGDPRGCEYREVTLAPRGYWQPIARPGVEPARARAFVLPAVAGDDRRFAIDWGGVLQRVEAVGPAADLDADARDRAAAIGKAREAARNERFNRSGPGFYRTWGGRWGRPNELPTPIEVCLLLRLGRADLAEGLFAAASVWKPGGPRPDLTDYGVDYLSLSRDWAWDLYVRGVDAHARGDDGEALDAFRRVAAFRKAVEVKAAAMRFPVAPVREVRTTGRPGYLGGLDQLDELLADQERRAKEPPRRPIPGRDADPAKRVAALIRDFDQIAQHQMSNPGGANPGGSPLVSDLIAMGDPAVEPLLRALVEDHRLTRSVSTGRVGESRHVAPTLDAILRALDGLMKTRVPGLDAASYDKPDTERRRILAAAYRRFWEANRAVPLSERHYRTLADDSARDRWIEAATALTSPPPDASGRPRYVPPDRPAPPPLGEPLRQGKEPSVTALLIRRIDDFARPLGDPRGFSSACQMAELLAKWDTPAALPVLHAMMDRIRKQAARDQPNDPRLNPSLAVSLAQFALFRARAGAREALDEYAAWVRTTTPDSFDERFGRGIPLEVFEPLWAEPDHPAIAAATRAMFAEPGSPWHDLRPGRGPWHGQAALDTSPLIRLPAFREAIYAGLANQAEAGTVERQAGPNPMISYQLKGSQASGSFGGPTLADIDALPVGEKRPVRACDWLAWELAKLDGTPRFELYWPEPRRDAAIAALVAFLKRYGDRYEATGPASRFNPFDGATRLAFPKLDHPATPADVEAGRAIFSLEGEGAEVRLVALPMVPLDGSWATLEDTPMTLQSSTPDGKTQVHHEFDRSGRVWQAEEVKVGDAWRRYYGFVGRSSVGRAPAAEVLFDPRPSYWMPPKGRFGVDLSLADPPEDYQAGLRRGAPVVVVVRVRNRTGLDQAAPTEFVRPGADGKPALRPGIALKLTRTDIDPTRPPTAGTPRPPEDLTPSHDARFTPGDASRILGPAAGFEAFRVDLRDWFDVTRPGQYRLVVRFGDESGMGPSDSGDLHFRVGD